MALGGKMLQESTTYYDFFLQNIEFQTVVVCLYTVKLLLNLNLYILNARK